MARQIDVPVGMALVPVEDINGSCSGCFFKGGAECGKVGKHFLCTAFVRKDGKSVIFKMEEYPPTRERDKEEAGNDG